jgi:hypothetical protein
MEDKKEFELKPNPGKIGRPEHASPQMANLILEMAKLMQSNNRKGLILMRRKIRNRLFKIRKALLEGQDPLAEDDSGLKKWIELQFNDHMKWYKLIDKNGKKIVDGGFTFEWDISAQEPLKVVESLEWDGSFDQVLLEKCNVRKCVPPAFTKQG